jgi:maleylpyruvate isomerase
VTTREWMDAGTKVFLETVAGLSDADFARATALPGWSQAHVVAHVHYNADALRRLAHWAVTGVDNRMYAGPHQRQDEIEWGAQLPVSTLRSLVLSSATALAADLDAMPESALDYPVITAQGRTVPAREVFWMRAREVWVHSTDLGVPFSRLPEDFVLALVVEAAGKHASGGKAAALAAWLTGRSRTPPSLGSWL